MPSILFERMEEDFLPDLNRPDRYPPLWFWLGMAFIFAAFLFLTGGNNS